MRWAPSRAIFAIFALAVVALPFVGGTYAIGIGLSLLMWIALVQSWTVLSAMAGYVSLGHVVFYGLGAYFAVLTWGVIPIWLALPLAGLLTMAFALLVGGPVLRVRGPYFVILTFGLAELVKHGVVVTESALGKFARVLIGTPSIETVYVLMAALAAVATTLVLVVRATGFGQGLRAIRENEEAAETVGVPVVRLKLFAYGLSAAIPGMVGAVMTMRTTYFEPQQAFDPVISFTIVTIAIIGGGDDARGPLLGSIFLVLLSELLWANAPQLYMIVLGILLIGFVVFVPNGLSGRLFRS